MHQPQVAAYVIAFGILVATAGMAAASQSVVESAGAIGGELVSEQDGPEVLENTVAVGPESGKPGTEAVFFSGCVLPGRSVSHRVKLPANGLFLHTVVPDRLGFNVVMNLKYPGLSRRINRFGPGRTEAFTVRTFSNVVGTVRISGVRGSFGCYRFGVTP